MKNFKKMTKEERTDMKNQMIEIRIKGRKEELIKRSLRRLNARKNKTNIEEEKKRKIQERIEILERLL